MKNISNLFAKKVLTVPAFENLDGELIVGDPRDPDAFHNTSGPLRKYSGEPDFKFYMFDCFEDPEEPYVKRWAEAISRSHDRLIILEQVVLHYPEEVFAYEETKLNEGYEGIMVRLPYAPYKYGRCTYNEMNMFKRKPFVITSATIIGFNEAMMNANEQTTNELGLSKRASNMENLIPKDTLGSFILTSSLWAKPFNARLGKGFTAEDNQAVWDARNEYMERNVLIKYQKHGSKDAPRIPSVINMEVPADFVSGKIEILHE
jgi:DNA ligase-1